MTTTISGIVAIVGRPNVGKSTLFNRLTRTRSASSHPNQAIVEDRPGVTRDRIYGQVIYEEDEEQINQKGFSLIDTGGFETEGFGFQPFGENLVWKQTQIAIDKADVVLLVFDGKSGCHPHDGLLLQYCKEKQKDIFCLVNKIDGLEKVSYSFEFYSLGIHHLHTISAAHNKGIKDLLAEIRSRLSGRKLPTVSSLDEGTKIALIGRPNAGKSSLLNALLGEARSLVSPLAGTTRDHIDTPYTYHKKPYVLIDTAGIRRKTKISDKIEAQSVVRSIAAIDRADVVVLVIDAVEGITDQDAKLLNLAIDRLKPVLLILNKWDLIPDKNANTAKIYEKNIHDRYLKEYAYLPILTISCTEKQRIHKVMDKIQELQDQSTQKASTAKLNQCLEAAVNKHSPQLIRWHSKRIKFYFISQVGVQPPVFVIMCNVADDIQESYKRYLAKAIQTQMGFSHVPIKLIFRSKKDQQEQKERFSKSETNS